jgi:hypothetical protein
VLLAAALIFAGSKMKNRESSKEGQTYIAKAGKTTKGITKNSKLGRIDEDIVKSILASSAGTPRPERFRIWHQYFLRELGDFDALRASETLNKIDKLEADGVLRSSGNISRMGLLSALIEIDPDSAWEWLRAEHTKYRGLFAETAWITAREAGPNELDAFYSQFGVNAGDLLQATVARVRDWVKQPDDLRMVSTLCRGLSPDQARSLLGNSVIGYFRQNVGPVESLFSISDSFGEYREYGEHALHSAIAQRDPQALLKWYDERDREMSLDLYGSVARGFVSNSPSDGINWITTIAHDELRGTTAASFVENWLRRDSFRAGQAAIDLMNAFGPGPESDSIASQVVQHLASKNELESASEWIANISNESLRVSLMRDFGIR